MKNSKIYVVANPALKLKMLKAELADISIKTSVSNDGIHEAEMEEFLYTEIASVNISLIDINRNQICIIFNSGKKLELISLSFGKLKNGAIHRVTVNQAVEFNKWVSELHKILVEKNLVERIDFSEGSNGKILLLLLLLLVCIIGIRYEFLIRKMGMLFTLLTGTFFIGFLLFKMGIKKRYDPKSKIL